MSPFWRRRLAPRKPLTERQHAVALLGLLIGMQQLRERTQPDGTRDPQVDSWVHRRVETLSMPDECSFIVNVSIDFTVPPSMGAIDATQLRYVPLTWFHRDSKLRGFDLRDEDSRPVPFLTRADAGALVSTALTEQAETILVVQADRNGLRPRPVLDAEVRQDLEHVAAGQRKQCDDAIGRFNQAAKRPPIARPSATDLADPVFQRQLLMTFREGGQDASLSGLLRTLKDNFVLIAVIPGEQMRRRRVLQMTYIDSIPRRTVRFSEWLLQRMGWTYETVTREAHPVEISQSYHCEFQASGDLDVVGARLVVGNLTRSSDDGSNPAHLWFSLRDLDPAEAAPKATADPHAEFALKVARGAFLRLAFLSCLLCALLLGLGRARLDEVSREIEATAALLVVIPTLLAAYLIRPGEHAVASMLLSGVRWMVGSASACAVLAGSLLILDVDPGWRTFWWTWLLLITVLATICVGLSNVLPRAKPSVVKPEADQPPRWFRYAGAGAVVLGLLFCGLGAFLWKGGDELGLESRLAAAIESAAGAHATRMGDFTRFHWTRLYVFDPGTPPDKVVDTLGEERFAETEHAEWDMSETVPDEEQLLVFVRGQSVVDAIKFPLEKGDLSCPAMTSPYYLEPTSAVEVSESTDGLTVVPTAEAGVCERTPG